MNNTLGKIFRVTSFGESHGPAIGVVIDGCPAGLKIDTEQIATELARRQPGQALTTPRNETDNFEILSGLFDGHTTGAPLCFMIRNHDIDSSQYEARRFTPRPGHADYTAFMKYGGFEDYRGGGRFSARVTAGTVIAGSIAKQLLEKIGAVVSAKILEIGGAPSERSEREGEALTNSTKSSTLLRGPAKLGLDPALPLEGATQAPMMKNWNQKIEEVLAAGDSVGGIIEGEALHLPVGLGEPIFDKLDAELAKALFTLPAVKGVEFGSGFASAKKLGSENNDPFEMQNGKVVTKTNHAGGILGGLSNGMPLIVRVAFKPISSIAKEQETIDLKTGRTVFLKTEGRFDPCPIPRAVPLVEAIMAIVLADFALRQQLLPRVLK